jgi:hypothetical protein
LKAIDEQLFAHSMQFGITHYVSGTRADCIARRFLVLQPFGRLGRLPLAQTVDSFNDVEERAVHRIEAFAGLVSAAGSPVSAIGWPNRGGLEFRGRLSAHDGKCQ